MAILVAIKTGQIDNVRHNSNQSEQPTYKIIPKRHSKSTITGATLRKMDTACFNCLLLNGSRKNTAKLEIVVE